LHFKEIKKAPYLQTHTPNFYFNDWEKFVAQQVLKNQCLDKKRPVLFGFKLFWRNSELRLAQLFQLSSSSVPN